MNITNINISHHQHMRNHQVVSHYSTSAAKPPLVIKVDELCDAICRYYYPLQVSLQHLSIALTRYNAQPVLVSGACTKGGCKVLRYRDCCESGGGVSVLW